MILETIEQSNINGLRGPLSSFTIESVSKAMILQLQQASRLFTVNVLKVIITWQLEATREIMAEFGRGNEVEGG